jgi:choline dehydrogenase-like flavoprotein
MTDVLIIGSGPVGSAFARLIPSSLRVTMIEAGPLAAEPPGVNVRNIDDELAVEARRRSQGPAAAPEAGSAVPVQVQGTITARDGTYLVDPGNDGTSAAWARCGRARRPSRATRRSSHSWTRGSGGPRSTPPRDCSRAPPTPSRTGRTCGSSESG